MWDFTSPRKFIIGQDALDYLSSLQFQNIFVITDPLMKKLHLEKIVAQLGECKVTIFDEIEGEPSLEVVRKGATVLSNLTPPPDAIIALGGGSVMDSAKGIRVMWAIPSIDIASLDPFKRLRIREKTNYCPMVSIPTTSGTGSDVTWSVVLTDASEGVPRKLSMAHRELVPDITILDPIFTATMPIQLMAGTGLDAMCHAIDAYLSTWRNDFSDAAAKHAFTILWRNLPLGYTQAMQTGSVNVEVREKLHNAATLAGLAQGNAQIILSHCLGHSIGAVFSIPHSLCIGASCWYSMMYNREISADRLADLAYIVGISGSSEAELAAKLINSFKNLLITLGMPISLSDMQISREQFENKRDSLIAYAENDSGSFANPRDFDSEDLVKIFESVYAGTEIDY